MDILIFLVFVVLFIGLPIFLLVKVIKFATGPVKLKYDTYFLSGYVNHNNITKLQRGACVLKFESRKFYIIQDNESIEDNCTDIYNMRIWEYKGGLYLAIKMKTHSEYKFSLIEPSKNNDVASAMLYKLFNGLAKRLKVELVECGESESDSEE
jgi:hypothetical protein